MKKIIALFLVFILLFSCTACSTEKEPTKIKFSQSIGELAKLDGEKVEINGFMSLLSPLNGEIIYLMNIPFQSCPFCVPNTTTLSNTIAVKGKNIEFTSQPVKITGTLTFGKFSDSYGYEYEFRIEDAVVTPLDEKEVSDKMKVYYTLSENDYIGILYTMCLFIDQTSYFEEYDLTEDDVLSAGKMTFENYDEIYNTISSLNGDGLYTDFLALFEKVNKTREDINKLIDDKDMQSIISYRETSDTYFNAFYEFINKYEF